MLQNKKNLSKKEITQRIIKEIGTSNTNITNICDDVINVLITELIEKEKINIKILVLLKFTLKNKRQGRNPKSRELYEIKSRKVINFKPSNFLKQRLNEIEKVKNF